MLLSVWVVIMMDYVITYVGIRAVGIEEANPFMVWLFAYDIFTGLVLRGIMALGICLVLNWIKHKNRKYYTRILVFFYAIMLMVFSLHIHWISYL